MSNMTSPRFDALRHDGGDAEIERAVEVVDDVVAGEVLRKVAEPHLESGMHVGADEGGHHGFVAKVDAPCACGQGDLIPSPDAGDGPVLDQEGRPFDRRAAIAGDDPLGLEQDRLRSRALDGECGREEQRSERYQRFAGQ